MNILKNLHNDLPGRRTRQNFLEKAIPPLWMWLRSIFFVLVGTFLLLINIPSIGKIFITFAFIQLAGQTLSVFFKEVDKGIKRYLNDRQKKK